MSPFRSFVLSVSIAAAAAVAVPAVAATQQLLNVSELPVVELGKKALEGYALTNKAGETRPCFFGCRRAGKNRTVTG